MNATPFISKLVTALILAFACVNPVWAVTYTAPPDQVNLRIPPIGTGGSGDTNQDITRSRIVISGYSTNQPISYFKLNLSLNHTYDGDLFITLITPDGTPITLANRLGGSGSNYVNTTFDDEAGRSISNGTPPFSGYFQPVTSFGFGYSFQSNNVPSQLPNGTWTLLVEDRAAGDTGTLLNWSLTFVLQPVKDGDNSKTLWVSTSGSQGSPHGPHGLASDTLLAPDLGLSFFADGNYFYALTNASGGVKTLGQAVPLSTFYDPAIAVLPDGMGGRSEWVFVTAADGYLYKFNALDGSSARNVDLKRGSCASDQSPIAPAVQLWTQSDINFRKQFPDGDSLVFVGTRDGCGDTSQNRILAFRASNLQRVWSFNGDGSYNINAITGMTLDYARDTLYAVAISAGGQTTVLALPTIGSISVTPKWSFNAGTVYAKPVLGDGCVYVAAYDGVLHKLNADTGAEIWSISLTNQNGLGSGPMEETEVPAIDPIRNMLFITDGVRLVAIKDQGDAAAMVWNRYTATVAWQCGEDLPMPNVVYGPVVAPDFGKLYVQGNNPVGGQIYQYDIASRTIEVNTMLVVNFTNIIGDIRGLILDSDNGGVTLNRLVAFGGGDGGFVAGRFAIPWYFKACRTGFFNAPTNDLAISVASITPPLQNGEAPAGQPLTYTLAVTNRGPGDVSEATVGDVLPPGLAFVSASVSQGHYSCSGNAFAAGLGTLTNGASSTVILTVLPMMSGALTHAATVAAASSYDPVPTNNTVDLSFIADAILTVSNASVLEPNIGTALMVFTVSLAAPNYLPVSVNYSTSDLTAQAGLDYLSTNGTLIFNPGETNRTISVPVMADTTISGDETFQIRLSYPTNAVLLFNQYIALGTIIDDDGPILLHISLAGGNALLSWSTNIEGFTLETTYDLNSGMWNQVYSPVGVVGDQNVVTNYIQFDTQFYRLRKYNSPPQ